MIWTVFSWQVNWLKMNVQKHWNDLVWVNLVTKFLLNYIDKYLKKNQSILSLHLKKKLPYLSVWNKTSTENSCLYLKVQCHIGNVQVYFKRKDIRWAKVNVCVYFGVIFQQNKLYLLILLLNRRNQIFPSCNAAIVT